MFVKKGDTLVSFDASIIAEKLSLSKRQIEETTLFVQDLSYMVEAEKIQT